MRFDTVDFGAAIFRVPVKCRENVTEKLDLATGCPGLAAGDVDLLIAAPLNPFVCGDLDRLSAIAEAQEVLRTGRARSGRRQQEKDDEGAHKASP